MVKYKMLVLFWKSKISHPFLVNMKKKNGNSNEKLKEKGVHARWL